MFGRRLSDYVDRFLEIGAQKFQNSHLHAVLISIHVDDLEAAPEYRTSVVSGPAWDSIRSVARATAAALGSAVADAARLPVGADGVRITARPSTPGRPGLARSLPPGQSFGGTVVLIAKKGNRPFQAQIGVGRASNVDIHLPLPKVSKYHGYFTRQEDDSYTFTDAESTNGTFIDSNRLEPKIAAGLRDGCEIAFGPHSFIYYGAEAFCSLVERRASLR